MLRTIKTFIKDPPPTAKLSEVAPGLNLIEGVVRVSDPLRSPVRGQSCVAFFYRAFLVMTEGRAPAFHKLREAEVYTSFDLEMEDGTLKVEPAKPGTFGTEDHQKLTREYSKGFQSTEDVIVPGARVRLRGKARRVGDGLVFKMKEISVIENSAAPASTTGGRKGKNKTKKKKKKKK